MSRPARAGRRPASSRRGVHYLPIVLFILGGAALTIQWPSAMLILGWPVTFWVVGWYLAASLVCFLAYAVDKSSAQAGRRRISEATLLLLGVIGGWPGAIVAQQTLRHKTQKVSFRRAFWVSVLLNVAVVGVLGTPLWSMFLAVTARPF